jgi:hypothetical protein
MMEKNKKTHLFWMYKTNFIDRLRVFILEKQIFKSFKFWY